MYIDEESGEDEEGGEVHGHDGLEEEGFEEVGAEAGEGEENGGNVGCQDDSHQTSPEDYIYLRKSILM